MRLLLFGTVLNAGLVGLASLLDVYVEDVPFVMQVLAIGFIVCSAAQAVSAFFAIKDRVGQESITLFLGTVPFRDGTLRSARHRL